MPRGQNPKSLENLKKRKKFSADDGSALRANQKSHEAKAEYKSISEEMKELASESSNDGKATRRKVLAAKLLNNMEKSPAWYELGLKVLGEMPAEEVTVNVDKIDSEETKRMLLELRENAKKRSETNIE